jgi:hypothetical protein
MTSPVDIIYTFDMAAVCTFTIRTPDGEDVARSALDSLEAISVTAMPGELDADAPAGMVFDVRTVAPRGRAYIVAAEHEDDTEVPLVQSDPGIPEPITGDNRSALQSKLDDAIEALEGDSNDAKHAALYGLASVVASVLGVEFDPRPPGDNWDD